MKKFMLVSVGAILCLYAAAQESTIKPLNVGDIVPDIAFINLYNYPTKTARLSDFKGKLVILDFWATWCGSCVRAFPKIQELQKRFKDSLQIIMINADTSESAEKVASFLDIRKKLTHFKLTLPYAVKNPFLNDRFPFKVIPQYVWINSSAEVVAITAADELTKENIERTLRAKTVALKEKNDGLLFNPDAPFLVNGNGSSNIGFIYRSVFTPFEENLGGIITNKTNSEGLISRYTVINYPLKTFFQLAYPEIAPIPLNRLIVEDPLDQDLLDQKYCYELNTLPIPNAEVRFLLKEDLYRAFGIKLKIEKHAFNTYTLTTNNNLKKSATKGGPAFEDSEDEKSESIFKNRPLSRLGNYLSRILKKPVTINNTAPLPNMDIIFPIGFSNWSLPEIRSFLSKKGLDLVERQQLLDAAIVYRPIVKLKKVNP
ncbi:TlpA disulfide reductase family protein [Niabella sp.]|uniref:TlpA family protein disulfide reductase n=1 Tax=Niabella sp. TaxID=1962976 RepID=UPI002603FA09|nr:TlpA disulfide reductase family protein [Niabella sp.]